MSSEPTRLTGAEELSVLSELHEGFQRAIEHFLQSQQIAIAPQLPPAVADWHRERLRAWQIMPRGASRTWFYRLGQAEDEDAQLKEADRAESQQIADQRELLILKKQNARLKVQNDGQLECIGNLSRTNLAFTDAMIGKNCAVRICEARQGRVIRVESDHATIAYDTADGRVEHVYNRTQFVDQKLPDEGDYVQAHAFIAFKPGPVRKLDEFKPAIGGADEFKAFREKRKTGPIVFRDPPD